MREAEAEGEGEQWTSSSLVVAQPDVAAATASADPLRNSLRFIPVLTSSSLSLADKCSTTAGEWQSGNETTTGRTTDGSNIANRRALYHRLVYHWCLALYPLTLPAKASIITNIAQTLSLFLISSRDYSALRNSKYHIRRKTSRSQPHPISFNQRKRLLVLQGVHVPDDQKLLVCLHNPRQELAEERERRVGDNDVGFIGEVYNLP